MKKTRNVMAIAALAAVTWFCINANAQTNSAWGKMMWSNYGPDSIKASWAVTNPADGSLTDANGNYIVKPWRIKLSAKISGELVTNWTTTSIEYPTVRNTTVNGATTLLYITTGYHETGVIISNTVATLEWNGKQVPVVLESVQIGTTNRVTWK